MNIGIDIRTLMSATRTGVGEYTQHLLAALFARHPEHEYHLFFNAYKTYGAVLPEWNHDHVRIRELRIPNKALNTSLAFLKRPHLDTLFEKKVDVFFSPNLHFTALSKEVGSVLTIHDLSFELFPECFSRKQRLWHKMVQPKKQCQRADRIFVPSESTKHDLVDHFGISEEKIFVTSLGLSPLFQSVAAMGSLDIEKRTQQVRAKYRLSDKFLLFLGTIEPRKNIDGLLDAFELWNKVNPALAREYTLVIAGPAGWKCKNEMRRITSDNRIQYLGYIDSADKPFIYRLASLFVFPSLYEGFGFPVLEAMASGTPVVTSNRSALPEVVGTAAHLINPYNIASIAEGVDMVLSDNNVRDHFHKKGLEQAKKFNWDVTAQTVTDIIKRLK